MAYPTPLDPASEPTVRRVFSISGVYFEMIAGFLEELARARSWYQSDGGITVDEALADIDRALDQLLIGGVDMFLGQIVAYARDALPAGVLPCDGDTYPAADYPELYAVLPECLIISAEYFRTPDLQGRCVLGAGAGIGLTERVTGDLVGAETVSLDVGQLPEHTHTYEMAVFADIDLEAAGLPQPAIGATLPTATGATGDGDPVSVMQPGGVWLYGMIAR